MRMISCVFVMLLILVSTAMSQQKSSEGSDVSGRAVDENATADVPANEAIDFSGFVRLTGELEQVRQSRRVPISRFNEMAREQGTIVLDTRSKRAFDLVHLDGAIHLNFSDFSDEKLRAVIPSKTTRILIYCNNNFKQSPPSRYQSAGTSKYGGEEDTNGDGIVDDQDEVEFEVKFAEPTDDVRGMTIKAPKLALNIPTFINLHGYGYENVYELADQIELDDPRLNLVGTEIKKSQAAK